MAELEEARKWWDEGLHKMPRPLKREHPMYARMFSYENHNVNCHMTVI